MSLTECVIVRLTPHVDFHPPDHATVSFRRRTGFIGTDAAGCRYLPGRRAVIRVLIVEDEALVAFDLAQQVEDLGHHIVGPAHTVAQALPLAEGERLDFALLDINLSGEQSAPIARALMARAIPFAFLTGYDSPRLAEDLGPVELLPKPVESLSLSRLLDRVNTSHPQT